MSLKIESTNVNYSEKYMETKYEYQSTKVERKGPKLVVTPQTNTIHLRTTTTPPRLGVMLVGWGGNNGSTLTAALIANKLGLSWRTKSGVQQANWFGSVTQASTVRLGAGPHGEDVYVPMCDLVPMVQPDELVVDGWDISGLGLGDAMKRAQVLEPELQDQLLPHMIKLKPRPAVYNPDFIAANQVDRADNLIKGTKQQQFEQICRDIDDFKRSSGVEKIIVLWTANTERFCEIIPGVNDTAPNLISSIGSDHPEISPSVIFATAAITKGCTYINGSPQNTFVQGVVDLAESKGVFIAGDDFKSGQTKIKSVLVDFLISAGIKPVSIVSYNHLGNNDGKNLSEAKQFKSKEISKSNVVDDMVQSNRILYRPQEAPDHCVVIKYVPYVGDSKRAMDEYTSELMLGGHNTLVVHNTCEDSLLAVPIILDLVLLAELFSRVEFRASEEESYTHLHPVLSILSYLCKAPLVPKGTPVVNALFKQRACIENFLRACLGLAPESSLMLEHKIPFLMKNHPKGKMTEEVVVANGNYITGCTV